MIQCFKIFLIKKKNSLYALGQCFSRFFISHTYSLHFNSPFSPLILLPLYIYPLITLHVIPCQLHTNQKLCHLSSIFQQHLPSSNIVASSNANPYELATIKGGLHFILSDNDNYDFDIKARSCEFVGFANDVIDYGSLECVFCFKIKEKEKYTFYINFYSIIFL